MENIITKYINYMLYLIKSSNYLKIGYTYDVSKRMK